MRRGILKKRNKKPDRKLFFLPLILTGLGLVAVADASAPQALNIFSDKFYFVKQQAIWAVVGIVVFLAASKIHYSFWQKIATPLFFATVILLVVVLLPQVGSRFLGARRWLIYGPISIQPSEIVKLTLAIYLSKVAVGKKGALSYFLPVGIVLFLTMLQPDLGTSVVIVGTSLIQIFASGINFFIFLGAGFIGTVASVLAILTSDYRKERLLTFLENTHDPLGSSYHIRQVLLALGSGGLLGVGLGQSRQKYLFLPEAATDSIFAVIAEEVGFIGSTLLLLLFAYFLFLGFKVASKAPDTFSRILTIGIITWIGGQVFLNIASMVAITPLTGVPLPFFSYGGSALVMVIFACGILINISKHVNYEK